MILACYENASINKFIFLVVVNCENGTMPVTQNLIKNARRNKHPRSLPSDGNGALQDPPAETSHRGYSLYYEKSHNVLFRISQVRILRK